MALQYRFPCPYTKQREHCTRDVYPLRDDEENWPACKALLACSGILAIYLVIVLKFLPQFMKNRPVFQMKYVLKYYNFFQVLFSLYLVIKYTRYMSRYGIITKRCPMEPVDRSEVVNDIWPYFIAKHVDLMDTVFFVLRKKVEQVSFLHVYHHCVMVTWSWLHLFYFPTDQFVFVGYLNSTVHVLMYTYYGLSTMGPAFIKYLWWKKHLTKVQLMQFILVLWQLHYQRELSPCPIPAAFHWFCMSNIAFFFVLFLKFYFSNYQKRMMKKGQQKLNSKQNLMCEEDNK